MIYQTVHPYVADVARFEFTEADESNPSSDLLIAAANYAHQILAGEPEGIVSIYYEAARRCGISILQLAEIRFRFSAERSRPHGSPDADASIECLYLLVRDYLNTRDGTALRIIFPMLS